MKNPRPIGNRGESLITVLVAVAILGLCFMGLLAGMAKFTKANRQTVAPSAACRDLAQNTIDLIRSNGAQTRSFGTPIDSIGGGVNFVTSKDWKSGKADYNSDGTENEIGAIDKKRWPNKYLLEGWATKNPPFQSNTPLLIQGAVNGLLSMYNADPGKACGGSGIDLNASNIYKPLVSATTVDGMPAQISLRLLPYSLHTGELTGSCPSPLWLRPYARLEPPAAVLADLVKLDNYRADLGLEAEVIVSLQRPEGTRSVCTAKSRFQFDRRGEKIASPILRMTDTSSSPSNHWTRVTVAVNKDRLGPGAQIFCSESHSFLPTGASAVAWAKAAEAAGAGMSFGGAIATEWLPCDRLRVCGRGPDKKSIDPSHMKIELSYHNLPWNCHRSVEARAMDVAGNLSDISTPSYVGTIPLPPGVHIPNPPDVPDIYSIGTGRSPSGGDVQSYAVAGASFASQAAAAKASMLSGQPVKTVPGPAKNPIDKQFGAVNKGVAGTGKAYDNALAGATKATNAANSPEVASALANAASAVASAQAAAAAGLPGGGSALSAATDAVTAATDAFNEAAAGLGTAQAAAAASAHAVSNMGTAVGDLAGAPGGLGLGLSGAITAAQVDQQTKKQLADAQAAYNKALENKKKAEELKKAAEEASKGDDGDDGVGG